MKTQLFTYLFMIIHIYLRMYLLFSLFHYPFGSSFDAALKPALLMPQYCILFALSVPLCPLANHLGPLSILPVPPLSPVLSRMMLI